MVRETAPKTAWRWGDYLLSPSRRRLLYRGETVDLEDRVFDLLLLLLDNQERGVDRQEITSAIWGKRPVSDVALRQLVHKARRAVGDDGSHQAIIRTRYGRSLQWIGAAQSAFDAACQPIEEVSVGADAATPNSAPVDVVAVPADSAVRDAPTQAVPRLRRRKADAMSRRLLLGGLVAAAVVALAVVGVRIGGVVRRRSVRGPSRATRVIETATASGPLTIAVLPFVEMDPKQGGAYFGDGIAEELINRLGRFPQLRVVARTSAFVYRGKPVDVRVAARALGVAYVLEGSVQQSDGRVRVSVALVGASDGYELWSDEYAPAAGDVLKVEDEIAAAVLKKLRPDLNPHELAVLDAASARAQVDSTAHDAYLVGLQYLNRRTAADIDQAIRYFKRATLADPGYADAWTGVATGYAVLRDYDPDEPPDTHYADALAAAQKAAMLDPRSAQVHAILGLLYMRHWRWRQAAAEYLRALRIDPNDATAHQWYGIYFWFVGDMKSALAQMRAAYKLDPLSPVINADLGRALQYAGDEDDALTQARKAVALAPRFELSRFVLASVLGDKRRYADAIKEIEAGVASTSSPPASDDLTFLGYMEWADGDHAQARRLLAEVEARSKRHYVSGVALASLEWPVGERDRAFANLDRAAADHDGLLMTVSGVRDLGWCADPRFQKLLASMDLPLH